MLKRILRFLGAVVVITVLLSAGLILWLSSSYGERFIEVQAEKLLTRRMNMTVSIGSLETNVFTRLVVRDIDIFRDTGITKEYFVTGDYTRLDYTLWSLIKGELNIDSIMLDHFEITVIQDSTGLVNTPEFGGQESEGSNGSPSLFSVNPGTVEIDDLTVRYTNRTLPLHGNLESVDISLESPEDGSYRFSLTADSLETDYKTGHVDIADIELNGGVRNGILSVTSFSAGKPGFALTGGASINLDLAALITDGSLTVKGNFEGLRQAAGNLLPDAFEDADGNFTLSMEVSPVGETQKLSGFVEMDSLSFRGWQTPHTGIYLNYQNKKVTIDSLDVRFADGTVTGYGEIIFEDKHEYNLNLTSDGVGLGSVLLSSVGKRIGLDGEISGGIELSGNLSDIPSGTVKANLQGTGLVFRNNGLPETDLNISYQNQKIQATAHLNENTLTAKGSLSPDSLDIAIDGEFSSLHTLAVILGQEMTGEGIARCRVYGQLNNPDVSLRVDKADMHYRNIPVRHLTGGFDYDDRGFMLRDISFDAEEIPADSLFSVFGIDGFSGKASYRVNASGKIDDMTGSAEIDIDQPSYRYISFDKGSFKTSFTGKELSIETISLERDSLKVSGSGKYMFTEGKGNAKLDFKSAYVDTSTKEEAGSAGERIWHDAGTISAHVDISDSTGRVVEVSGDSIEVHNIAGLLAGEFPLGGTMSFALDFSGTVDRPYGRLNMTVDNPSYGDFVIDDFTADIRVKPDSVWIPSVKIISGKGNIRGNAGLSLHTGIGLVTGSDRIEGTLTGNSLDLSLFKPLVPEDMDIFGKGEFDISWNGTIDEPSYKGSFRLTEGAFGGVTARDALRNITVDARLEDNRLYLDTAEGTIKDVPLAVTGDVRMETATAAEVNIKGHIDGEEALTLMGFASSDSLDIALEMDDFNLTAVRPFATYLIGLDGVANTAIYIKGKLSAPVMTGGMSMNEVTFKTPVFNRPVTDGIIDLSFENRTVTVDTLLLRSKEGTVEAGGHFTYNSGAFDDLDLSASIQNMKIDQPDKYNFMVENGDITYRKTDDGNYHLAGSVTIDEGTIDYNLKPQEFLVRNRDTGKSSPQEPSAILTNTHMNIRIRNDNPIWVDNNVAHVSLNTGIELTGTADKPNITGRISTEDGYVLYLDRRFEIARGTLDFINPTRINPIIDFRGVANIQQIETFAGETYVITLNVNGPLDEAAIVIDSSPALSKAEIMALLTFGATTEQISASDQESSTGSIMMERVTELSSRVATNYLSRKISSMLGIRGLYISGNLAGGQEGSQMDASEKIERQLKSEYTPNVGESNNRGIRLRYDLSRFFSIEGYTNQTGQGGIDLEYSVTFE